MLIRLSMQCGMAKSRIRKRKAEAKSVQVVKEIMLNSRSSFVEKWMFPGEDKLHSSTRPLFRWF